MKPLLYSFVFLCGLSAVAQDTAVLNQVEITATSNNNKSLLYQPSSISKLTSRELKRGNGLFLDDAINVNVPGITMNRRAVSSGQQFNIRGYGNGSRGTRGISSNFDGQGYKLYLNGIPVTDAEGITLMDDIDFNSIGSVEVLKGPAGSLYGLAIAGVVNLKSIKPEPGKTSLQQDVMIGNYGLQRYTTHFKTATAHSSLLLNYGHQASDGFTVHNASRKDFANLSAEFQPDAKQTVNVYLGYSNSYDERSGELTITQYDNNDFSGNTEYIKRNAHSNVYSIRAGLGYSYSFTDHVSFNTTVFGTGLNSNASSAGGWTDKQSLNLGLRSTVNTQLDLAQNVVLSGITGVETQRQNAQTIGYIMVKDPRDTASVWTMGNPYYFIIGASNSNVFTVNATTSVFTEWTLALPKEFSITAGLGYSNLKIQLDDRFYVAGKPTHYDTTYNGMFSPRVAVNKVFDKHISAYASYSRAYKAPVSSYFFLPFNPSFPGESGIVNKNLSPEIGDQFEIGTKGSLLNGRLDYQLALFEAIFSNKMTTVAVPFNATTTLYSYVTSGGKQNNKGVEAALKWLAYLSKTGLITAIAPFGNFTYSDFKYEDYKFHTIVGGTKDSLIDYSDKQVAGVPKFMGNLGVDIVTRPGVYANMTWTYKDGFPFTSDGINRTSSYNLLNAKIGIDHSLSKHVAINAFFGVNNITGVKYPMMVFVNQLPDAYIAGPSDPNYFAGINLNYTF